ncbi:hypothetical protein E2C01_036666 [Portunus trituberculatus]|uniref:Uncharacterized protein n=1 Tax=Portunus trituberculatus TaxID=210409 RepID=A0A5B7F7A8_PORTR|nr:hypothetical protein [Portunus trituberculatus]
MASWWEGGMAQSSAPALPAPPEDTKTPPHIPVHYHGICGRLYKPLYSQFCALSENVLVPQRQRVEMRSERIEG